MKKRVKKSIKQIKRDKRSILNKKQLNKLKGGEDYIGIIDIIDG